MCGNARLILLQEWILRSPLCCIESIHVLRTWAPDARPSTWPTTVRLLHDQVLCSSRAVHPPPTSTDIAECRVWTATHKIRSNRCDCSSWPTVVWFLNCQVLPSQRTTHLPSPKMDTTDSGQLLRTSDLTTANPRSLPTNAHLLHTQALQFSRTNFSLLQASHIPATGQLTKGQI